MKELFTQPVEYWASGGPLLAPIAVVCFGIWFYVLRAHRRITRVLARGVALENAGCELAVLRRDFVVLEGLVAAAPLLGLLGTVGGMIATFHAVSCMTGETGPGVASGVSRALITTQFGLVVAIPGLFGLSRLRRMYERVERNRSFRHAHEALMGGGAAEARRSPMGGAAEARRSPMGRVTGEGTA